MTAAIASSAIRTCLGDGEKTFEALLRGASGIGPLTEFDERWNLLGGYEIRDPAPDQASFRASTWLSECARDALAQAGVDSERERVIAIVGTGLRELRELERWSEAGGGLETERLHFAGAVRDAAPGIDEVITLSNACSAGGHALALAQDLIELGEADAVLAAGADTMTASMLAMIGRVSEIPAERVQPFDAARGGALLGEGAAAIVVVADGNGNGNGMSRRPLARLLATGMSCDAHHETAADGGGIARAVTDAFARAGRRPGEVDLVIAHGTGTAINDPLESELLAETFGRGSRAPLVTAVKGALGHTSGAAALMSVDVALRCLAQAAVPPIVGLSRRIPEAVGLPLVTTHWGLAELEVVQVNAFGFGGVNAVTLLEAIREY
ncbi:MAG TPA: beta-ketoacyl synthase N-terminal-like domain-containing protein [Solirubrobacteraceae bacterium]|nr:beta-ketoacyl synthase N-terminal-like domain-containing protein [Solirubrobacteraceae bacterium]